MWLRRSRVNQQAAPSNSIHSGCPPSNLLQLPAEGFKVGDGDLNKDDILIGLMGPTGSGKSSFIELAAGINGIAGHSLQSCTHEISVIKLECTGLNLCLVDTPGFDDTNTSDLDVFKLISSWLMDTYKKQIRLTGLLYFHRISDNRMTGTSCKNFRLFEKLCGEDFSNIVLTTTMWDEVDESVGALREEELKQHYWRPMIERGSYVKRFLYTRESALSVLAPILVELRAKATLLLQKELNDLHMKLKETSAGKTLYMNLGELVTRHGDDLGRIRHELKDSMKDSTMDADKLRLLMEDYQKVSEQLQRATEDMRKLKISTIDRIYSLVRLSNWIALPSVFMLLQKTRPHGKEKARRLEDTERSET